MTSVPICIFTGLGQNSAKTLRERQPCKFPECKLELIVVLDIVVLLVSVFLLILTLINFIGVTLKIGHCDDLDRKTGLKLTS